MAVETNLTQQLQEKIQARQWFHSIDLGDGVVTPGRVSLEYLQLLGKKVGFPDNFTGQKVLDIGAWDGFFSFEAERRGAQHVQAVDVVPVNQTGFNLVQQHLDSQATYTQMGVYDLSPSLGSFDTVIFLGVLYHLRYPVLALDKIWSVLKPGGTLLLETACLDDYVVLNDATVDTLNKIDPALEETSLLQFYRMDELNPGDFSNWFSFSRKALEDLLVSAGFQINTVEMWGSRIAVHATKLDGEPEYMKIKTYEAGESVQIPFSSEELVQFEVRRKVRQWRTHTKDEAPTSEPFPDIEAWERSRKILLWLRHSLVYKIMRKLGRWNWLDASLTEILES